MTFLLKAHTWSQNLALTFRSDARRACAACVGPKKGLKMLCGPRLGPASSSASAGAPAPAPSPRPPAAAAAAVAVAERRRSGLLRVATAGALLRVVTDGL